MCSLASSSDMDRRIKGNLMTDIFHMVGVVPTDRKKLKEKQEEEQAKGREAIMAEAERSGEQAKEERHDLEFAPAATIVSEKLTLCQTIHFTTKFSIKSNDSLSTNNPPTDP